MDTDPENKKDRSTLERYFQKNAIPKASEFAQLIRSNINQAEDRVFKPDGEALSIEAVAPGSEGFHEVLNFFTDVANEAPDWRIALRPRSDPGDAATARFGLGILDGARETMFAIDAATGNVGIGTAAPQAKLDVAGPIAGFGVVPVGTIVAWHKSLRGTPALPDGWAECNGQEITDADSPYNGRRMPDLNDDRRFLRGANSSGDLEDAAVGTHDHNMNFNTSVGGNHDHAVRTTLSSTNLGAHAHTTGVSQSSAGAHSHLLRVGTRGTDESGLGLPPSQFGRHSRSVNSNTDNFVGTQSVGSHTHTIRVNINSTNLGSHTHAASTDVTPAGNHTHFVRGTTSPNAGGTEPHPVNMSVVWIMRIK